MPKTHLAIAIAFATATGRGPMLFQWPMAHQTFAIAILRLVALRLRLDGTRFVSTIVAKRCNWLIFGFTAVRDNVLCFSKADEYGAA